MNNYYRSTKRKLRITKLAMNLNAGIALFVATWCILDITFARHFSNANMYQCIITAYGFMTTALFEREMNKLESELIRIKTTK